MRLYFAVRVTDGRVKKHKDNPNYIAYEKEYNAQKAVEKLNSLYKEYCIRSQGRYNGAKLWKVMYQDLDLQDLEDKDGENVEEEQAHSTGEG